MKKLVGNLSHGVTHNGEYHGTPIPKNLAAVYVGKILYSTNLCILPQYLIHCQDF